MALTQAELNTRLKETWAWAQTQLSDQQKTNILNTLKGRNGKILPFDKMAGFEIKGSVYDCTISHPPKMTGSDGRAFYPQDLKMAVSQESYVNVALLIYTTVKSWEITQNRLSNPDNLIEIFGNKLPVSVKPRVDRNGNPAEGVWVNMSCSVTTNAVGDLAFQNIQFASTVEGKTINVNNADELLKPTDTQRSYVTIKPSVYFTGKGTAATRCSALTLIPAPQREESLSVDDLLGMGGAPMVASSQPQPVAQPVAQPAPQPTAASQAPTAPAPLEPAPATTDDILGMIQI